MTKWESVNKLADYLRVNASVAPMKLSDLTSACSSLYDLSVADVSTVIDCLLRLGLIVVHCPDGNTTYLGPDSFSFLWIGKK